MEKSAGPILRPDYKSWMNSFSGEKSLNKEIYGAAEKMQRFSYY